MNYPLHLLDKGDIQAFSKQLALLSAPDTIEFYLPRSRYYNEEKKSFDYLCERLEVLQGMSKIRLNNASLEEKGINTIEFMYEGRKYIVHGTLNKKNND